METIALEHVGVVEIYDLSIDYDRDDNKYEIEFKSGNVEYDYENRCGNWKYSQSR